MFSRLKKLRARVRYLVDRAFAREFAGQLLLLFVLGKTMGLRVEKDDERMGLDQSSHSETGYNY